MFNRYTYVGNDPINETDPTGQCPWCVAFLVNPAAAAVKIAKVVKLAKIANKPQSKKTYQTYTKNNPITKEKYTGRASGTGTPEQNVAKRDSNHHMNSKGFGKAQVDKSSSNPDAIRGREQQLIDQNGGAKSQGGNSGNAINGIADSNPKKPDYVKACNDEFCGQK